MKNLKWKESKDDNGKSYCYTEFTVGRDTGISILSEVYATDDGYDWYVDNSYLNSEGSCKTFSTAKKQAERSMDRFLKSVKKSVSKYI